MWQTRLARPLSRVGRPIRHVQTQSTQRSASGYVASHLGAFALGGVSVIAGGYAYYHFSGLKPIVDRALAVRAQYRDMKVAYAEEKPRSPAEAVAFLRRYSRSKSGPVPDTFVDMVSQFQGDHEEDIDNIVFGACDDIRVILAESKAAAASDPEGNGAKEGLSSDDRVKIASIVQRRAAELRARVRERKERSDADSEPRGFKSSVVTRFKKARGDVEPRSEEEK